MGRRSKKWTRPAAIRPPGPGARGPGPGEPTADVAEAARAAVADADRWLPADFDLLLWSRQPYRSVLESLAAGVRATAARHRPWLLRLLRGVVEAAGRHLDADGVRRLLDPAGPPLWEVPHKALDDFAPRAAGVDVVYFVREVGRSGLAGAVAAGVELALDEYLPVARDLAADPDPAVRAGAAWWAQGGAAGAEAVAVLGPVLGDADARARWAAAVGLARVAADTPGLSRALWEAAGEWWQLPFTGGEGWRLSSGQYTALGALAALGDRRAEGVGPEVWPGLVAALTRDTGFGWQSEAVVRTAVGAVRGLGRVSVAVLFGLDAVGRDRREDMIPDDLRRAARDAGRHLEDLLRQGRAVADPGEDPFLLAAYLTPRDPLPGLAYADWLDDRGDPRGGYVRATLARAAGSSDPGPDEWAAGFRAARGTAWDERSRERSALVAWQDRWDWLVGRGGGPVARAGAAV